MIHAQGSPEWFADRCGKITASRIADVIAKTKTGASTSRANYAAQLVAERMTGKVEESYTNAAMQWGTDQEPYARMAYEARTGDFVTEVGSIPHPDIPKASASPDGTVGDKGLVEIKCPNTATHISYLLGQKVPAKYIPQMAWQIACTGREWCDFVSFDPRMPEDLQLFVVRYTPEIIYIVELEQEVIAFDREVRATIYELTALIKTGEGNE